MQFLANLSVRHPIVATVMMLMIAVIGVAGYAQLGVDRFPKLDFPVVQVLTVVPGSAPEEIESDVTDKIEEAVNTISGIDELRSITSEGVSLVYVTFVLDKDIDVAAQEVRDRIATVVPELPLGAETPVISKLDPDASPILFLAVKADKSVRELTEVADKQVRRALENVSGVGQLTIIGGRQRQLNVWVDPVRLRASGVTAAEVQRTIATQNVTMPGGSLDNGPGQVTLRVKGRVTSPEELGELVVRTVDDHPIRVRDVARIEDGEEEAESAALRDGAPAVVLAIRKQSGSNTVQVVDAVRERVAELSKTLPRGYSIEVVRDSSSIIRTSVHAVTEHLVLGALFAAAVVLLFLGNLRSTVIAALAIPISIIGSFALMWIQGFSLNTLTLLALALSVGIVIDDAIVVLENIFRFVEEKGLKPAAAAILATREIGLAVLATTLSLIGVFLPVAFMGGIVGRFLNSFGLTMSFAIAVSLVVSFTLTPMLSSRWLRPVGGGPEGRHTQKTVLERLVDGFYLPIERAYERSLRWVMVHRWVVVVACVVALGSIVPLAKVVPAGFLPVADEAQFEVNVRAPEGTSLAETTLIGERVASQIRRRLDQDGLLTLTLVGGDQSKTKNRASIYVRLTDPEQRTITQHEYMDIIRKEVLATLPKNLRVDVSVVPPFQGGGSAATIQYEISGPDLQKLQTYSNAMAEAMRAVPGAVDVDTSFIAGKPEVQVRIDREKAAALGVSVADIAVTLRTLVSGAAVSSYLERGEQYDVNLRAEPEYRADADGLSLVSVPSARGGTVPLMDVVHLEEATGPSAVNHLNRRRQVLITANNAKGSSESAILGAAVKAATDLKLPAGYAAGPAARSKEMAKAGQAFVLAFLLSFVFVYLILAAQFESWLLPIPILMSLPLTLPFALISLLIFDQQLDIYSCLGLLVLFGVVKKNSILQIDHTNQLRARGMNRLDAIIRGSRDRLRPILMTTLAFVAGMVPLLFSNGIGAGFNQATAGVIVGGQVLSLLLTLLATPVAYSLFDDLAVWFKRVLGGASQAEHDVAQLDQLLAEAEGKGHS